MIKGAGDRAFCAGGDVRGKLELILIVQLKPVYLCVLYLIHRSRTDIFQALCVLSGGRGRGEGGLGLPYKKERVTHWKV